MTTILAYVGAALAEIAGCFAFWALAEVRAKLADLGAGAPAPGGQP